MSRLAAPAEQGDAPPSPRGGKIASRVVFLLVAIGLMGALFLVWNTITSEREERAQAERTMQVMSALRDLDRAALNAETGQRGYFITLDRDYLASYEMGRALYPRALRRLRRLVLAEGSTEQRNLLSRIEEHGAAKFAELDQTIGMIREGRILDAQQVILSKAGMQEMKALRQALSEMEATEQAILSRATDEAAVNENRVLPLLSALMLGIVAALVLGFAQSIRAAQSEERASRAEELAEAKDRADLLAHELNHRVKNLFAVILAIVQMSARGQTGAQQTAEIIAARIRALLDAHEATQGGDDSEAELVTLIEKVLAPYRSDENPVEVTGPPVRLTMRQATPIGLVLHELATNAVKYGAWSQEGGRIEIDWSLDDTGAGADTRELHLKWREICPQPAEPGERRGFGSMLMESSARQLNGSIERHFDERGAEVNMRIPHG
ncbi:CHASE3 domain-containing protein [uncultured Croceicoccus sp.]|uniref:sensor histidine kinase n=1 Tax=uncultured Croceicoccus sp. TaxID=1295329 RepID=UPI0026305E80|nr:CHASE3 domain-containing protein [uncultured Croceicoccus sp.]